MAFLIKKPQSRNYHLIWYTGSRTDQTLKRHERGVVPSAVEIQRRLG